MAIYHYTDLNGFKGIVESNALWAMGYGLWAMGYGLWAMGYGLWATNIYFLNDREEFHHGYKCFLNALDDNYVIDGVKE